MKIKQFVSALFGRKKVKSSEGYCICSLNDKIYIVVGLFGGKRFVVKTFQDEDSEYALRCAEELLEKLNEKI